MNGERITGAVVLNRTGVLRVGNSEIRVKIGPTDATVVRETPAERPPTDATAVRERVADYGGVGAPDDTRARARPEAPAGERPERVAAPVAAARPQPAPAPARVPAADAAPRSKAPLVAGTVVVAAVVAVLTAAQTGGAAKTRRLSAKAIMSTISIRNDRQVLAGVQSGSPLTGSVTADETFAPGGLVGNPKAIPVSSKFVMHSDNGSVTSILQLTVTKGSDQSYTYVGRGTIVGGTGAFNGASGSFAYKATQPPASLQLTATLNGTLKY